MQHNQRAQIFKQFIRVNAKTNYRAPFIAKVLFVSSLLSVSSFAQATINECDKLAAHFQNTTNPENISGVSFYEIEPEKAIGACIKAVKD